MAEQTSESQAVIPIEVPTFYASGARIVADPTDFSIYLSSIKHALIPTSPDDTASRAEFIARVVMSPQSAKALSLALSDVVKRYEEQNGRISVLKQLK